MGVLQINFVNLKTKTHILPFLSNRYSEYRAFRIIVPPIQGFLDLIPASI